MLQVHSISAQYGNHVVLDHLSFSLEKGITAILGANGCGKTTLFRVISGQLSPAHGDVLWNDRSLLRMKVKNRAQILSFMTQEPKAARGILAIDFIEMGYFARSPFFYSIGKAEHEEVFSLACQYGCEGLLTSRMEELSSGEQQLIALLAVMIQNTPVLLLDEPTSSLDYHNTNVFLRSVRKLEKEKQTTILMILHDPSLAIRYCDRILTIKNGHIEGDFFPKMETEKRIREQLRLIYPEIEIITHQGQIICY